MQFFLEFTVTIKPGNIRIDHLCEHDHVDYNLVITIVLWPCKHRKSANEQSRTIEWYGKSRVQEKLHINSELKVPKLRTIRPIAVFVVRLSNLNPNK